MLGCENLLKKEFSCVVDYETRTLKEAIWLEKACCSREVNKALLSSNAEVTNIIIPWYHYPAVSVDLGHSHKGAYLSF